MKDNTIILIIDGTTTFHNSVDEAIEESQRQKHDNSKIANIYTLIHVARKSGFSWNTAQPKVVRKESTEKRTMKWWTDAEDNLLVKAKKDGKTIKEIAQLLYRTEKAINLRWNKHAKK